jgi:hypothetical protein
MIKRETSQCLVPHWYIIEESKRSRDRRGGAGLGTKPDRPTLPHFTRSRSTQEHAGARRSTQEHAGARRSTQEHC